MMAIRDDLAERHVSGGLVFGIGKDSLGEYAECYEASTGTRIAIEGPCLDARLIRSVLGDMIAAGAGVAEQVG